MNLSCSFPGREMKSINPFPGREMNCINPFPGWAMNSLNPFPGQEMDFFVNNDLIFDILIGKYEKPWIFLSADFTNKFSIR